MSAAALKVYVGYDSREDIAWQVCRHSLLRHTSIPISVHPLRQSALREMGVYTRDVDARATTEFSLTRFLTPYLAAHSGWSLFVDCDFLFTRDIGPLIGGLSKDLGVYVVKHDYVPKAEMKMDNKIQTSYPRKNWSSFILFNGANPHVRALGPQAVNEASPAFLHRFEWIPDDFIGGLGCEWNFLEGEYPVPGEVPAAIHYTNGGPWFPNCQKVDFAGLWLAERDLVAGVKR